MSALAVIEPGFCTTVQDGGRTGYQAFAVPVCGARDRESLRLANTLVGNPVDTAALEIAVTGPILGVEGGPVRVAAIGAEGYLEIIAPSVRQVPFGRSVSLPAGTVFRVGSFQKSFGLILAIAGGFDLPPVLGSYSTCLAGGFGGFRGRSLRAGDVLPLGLADVPSGPERLLPFPLLSSEKEENIIRVVAGPQQEYLSEKGRRIFYQSRYTLASSSDRMGLRLEGEKLEHSEKGFNLVSDGIVTGAIQVPGNGQPIILFNDHQLTGGYPKIATVISADLATLGRISPGEGIRFREVTVKKAEEICRQYEKRLQELEQKIVCFDSENEARTYCLACLNLVEGVHSF